MAMRKARAEWQGGLKEGRGTVAVGSGVYEGPYSYKSRFTEDEQTATNPEELIGAAHAGCYSMQLGAMLEAEGHPPDYVRTEAAVELRAGEGGSHIRSIRLSTTGRVPSIDAAKFEEVARDAKEACLITQALGAVPEITLDINFEG